MNQPRIFYYFRLFLFVIFFSFLFTKISYAGTVIVGTAGDIIRGQIPTITWTVTGASNCDRSTNYDYSAPLSGDGIAAAWSGNTGVAVGSNTGIKALKVAGTYYFKCALPTDSTTYGTANLYVADCGTGQVGAYGEPGTVWNGSSCVAGPSASFTSTPSCTISAGNSTCNSPVSWTSSGVSLAVLTDCGGGLYTSQGVGARTYNTNGGVTVPYGTPNTGGCYQIHSETSGGTVLATTYSTGSCATGSTWNGSICQQNTHTVTFNGNGSTGGTTATQTITEGYTVPLNTNGYTRTGYTFDGWATSAGGSVIYTDGASYAMGVSNVILYAHWTVIGGISVSISASPSSLTLPANSTTLTWTTTGTPDSCTASNWWSGAKTASGGSELRTGMTANTYVFDITCSKAGVADATASVSVVVGNTPSHTVTFNGNGSTGGTTATQTITEGSSATLNTNGYTRTGYTFSGWNTASDGSGNSYADGASYTMGVSNVTLYAQWTVVAATTHRITFNKNGGSGTMSTQTITDNTSANLTLNSYTKTGYIFAGWATTATGVIAYADGDSYTMGTSNVTLYARWTSVTVSISASPTSLTLPNSSTTLTWVTTGSPNSCVGSNWWSGAKTASGGSELRTGMTANNYVFDLTCSKLGEPDILASVSVRVNSAPSHRVTFNSNGGSGHMSTQTITDNTSANLTLNSYTKTGYSFAGWATTSGGSVAYADGASYAMGASNVTLYAKWVSISVSISASPSSLTLPANSTTLTWTTTGSPTSCSASNWWSGTKTASGGSELRTGMVANSYIFDITCSKTGESDATSSVTVVVSPAQTHTITFNGNGSTGGSTATQTISEGSTATLTSNGYTRTGYTFSGWNTASDGSGTSYANGASYTMGVSNVTLYAKWNVIVYSCSGTAPSGGNFTSRGASTSNGTWAYAGVGECTWSCNTGYAQNPPNTGTVCNIPPVITAYLTGNHTDTGSIDFSCSDTLNYNVIKDTSSVTKATTTYNVGETIHIPLSVAGSYQINCWNDGLYAHKTYAYDPQPLVTDSVILNASPKTTKAGTVSTLTWSINNPIDTCSLKAYSDNASDAIRLNALLSTTTLTNKTDANDPYGNRSMLEALTQTTTNSTKAMGKKSVTINYTTDFELKCTVPAPSANPTNRIRVQVTNENEG